jgi:glycosyltransferase involved in cell wall biosynthesis
MTGASHPLRVAVATGGRFYSFDLARELDRAGALACIHTGYPRFKLGDTGVDPARIDSFPWLTTLYMALIHWPRLPRRIERELAWAANGALDRRFARKIANGRVDCDVVSALSGGGLAIGQAAHARGIAYVCDRGSSHIAVQDRLLREEYAMLDLDWPGVDPRVVAKERAEYALADAIALPSGFAVDSFVSEGIPRAKLHHIPYGVDLERFRRTQPRAAEFRVLYVGSLSVRKGIHYLLQGFARAGLANARLVLVGGASTEGDELIRRFPVTGLERTGHLPPDQVAREMSRASVLVLPSIEDGFGLVLTQALACGCPILATTNTGGPDLVTGEDVGFVVPIRDPDALAERLVQLQQAPALLAAQSAAAVERVRRLGGWDEYGRRALALFQALAAVRVP